MTGDEAIATLQRRYKKQNEFIKNNYDRFTVCLKKGTKDKIKETGMSLNSFINSAIEEKLAREKENKK